MSDLDGMDAFTTVLDRMVDAETRMALQSNLTNVAESQLRQAILDLGATRSILDRVTTERDGIEAKHAKAIRVGTDLWKVVHDAVNNLNYEKLKVAMNVARDPFDDIPF